MKLVLKVLSVTALLALLAPADARAQTITRVVPEAASPGDLLIIQGTGLEVTTSVNFLGIVGGFVGDWMLNATPISVSPTEVRVLVPLFNNFIDPDAGAGSSPYGTLSINHGPLNTFFFYCEGTGGQLETLGTGTTQPGPQGKPVISFTLAGGPPEPGNASCTLMLENATTGASAFLLAGFPAHPPYAMFGDGTLVVDVNLPFVMLGPFPVNSTGDSQLALPIPAGVGLTVALQWGFKHPVTHAVILSNGFQAEL